MKIANIKIKGITSNSKRVKKGFAFVAIKGSRQDGGRFINEAVDNGACLVVVKRSNYKQNIPKDVKRLEVDNCRKFLAKEVSKYYGFPSDKLKLVGITGTNGKTTIAYLIEALAKKSASSCGVIGTINYRFPGKTIQAQNTTPGPEELQKLFFQMLAKKVKYCAMEVSSHALDQDRVEGIKFRRAIFTNLTQDHLDYHKDLENYFLAKAKLFRSLPASGIAIINNDDPYGCRIKKITGAKVMTYGIRNRAMVSARDIDFRMHSTEFTLVAPKINVRIRTSLVGRHNIYNLLAAIAWGISEKIKIKDIKSAVEGFKNVPGRLERIGSKKEFAVFVDYAHTPDALFNVISSLRPLVRGRIIVVFGCGGERDKLKRPKMGKIVTGLADYAIITSDNPRSDDPGQIIRDICAGIDKNNYCIIPERFKAIRKGLALVKKGDCLLIAGKGHEDYQILKNKVLDFCDRKVARECLRSMK